MIAGLDGHLEAAYGIRVVRTTPLEPWGPQGAQRVDRAEGISWVARVFPPERHVDAAHGDAEILRFLERHGYPAERCAHDEPVTMFGDRAVLVTELVPGANLRGDTSSETVRAIGRLTGWLHALPQEPGAVSRQAGGWHHLSTNGGGRRADVDALLPAMERAAARLSADEHALVDQLVEELQAVDDHERLPQALINVDLGGPNVMRAPDASLATVDWTGSGRGARVHSLSGLLYGDVDAFVHGYREHITLEDAELDVLHEVLPVHALVLDCWSFAFAGAPVAPIAQQRPQSREQAKRIADRVHAAFSTSGLT